jgi:cation:H+ antiporter
LVPAVAYLLVGAAVLMIGSRAAARAAAHLALRRGMPPFVVGALFYGMNVGSVATVLVAAGRGQTTIALAAALGTNVVLVMGFGAALLSANEPVRSPGRAVILLPAGALVLGAAAVANEHVTRLEGAALVVAYLAYLALIAQEGRVVALRGEHAQQVAAARHSIRPEAAAVFGLALAYLGAMVLVGGGIRLVGHTSLTAGFVGAAIVGSLASLDETLLVVIGVRRGISDLAVGTVFGAFAAVPTGILGLAALVRPLTVDPAASSAFFAVAALYTVVATVFLGLNRAWRRLGLAILVLYAAWVAIASRL